MLFVELYTLCCIEYLFQIRIYMFHDNEDMVHFLNIRWGYHVYQFSCENIAFHGWQLSQNLDFTQNFFGLVIVAKRLE